MILQWNDDYQDYLRDESRLMGSASSISFPKTEAEVVDIVRQGECITVQGARTGITAGAVPSGGHVMNLSHMNAVGEVHTDEAAGMHLVTVQPGALLADVRRAVAERDLFFPPDPTETSASIGGMVACNASGAMSFHYGPTRDWVQSISLVTGDGRVVRLRRGECMANGRSFSLAAEDGSTIAGELPEYTPPGVKSAAGYYVADGMDMLDLFVGMEGTLGIVTEVELRLIPKPGAVAALNIFFPSEEAALKFVCAVRGETGAKPVAIEFFNRDALDLLRKMKSENPAFGEIPALKPHFDTAVYVEFHCENEDGVDEALMTVMEMMAELGAGDDDAWCATNEREMEKLKAFRHAIPEAVNLLIDERRKGSPSLTKLGTDMSVPDSELLSVMGMYNEGLAESGLDSVIFGHIGNNHLHVNILPKSMDEYDAGKALYALWARRVVELGGSVSAEHGIGKIKVPFAKLMYGEESLAEMRALKKLFDPDMLLNRGNLFDSF